MIKYMNLDNLDLCLDFAYELCKDFSTSSYPIKKTREELKESFLKHLAAENFHLPMYFKDNRLIGIVELFIDHKENYVRLVTYIKEDFKVIVDEIIEHLKCICQGYTMDICYPKENILAIEYFKNKGFECTESCIDLRLDIKDLKSHNNPEINLERLKKEDFSEYAAFHNKHGGLEMYWNSTRIYEAYDKWYIYVYRKDSTIVASSLTCKAGKDGIEIFAFFLDDMEDKTSVYKELLGYTIKEISQIDLSIRQVIYFIESEDEDSAHITSELGFKKIGDYRCYSHLFSPSASQ